MCSSDLYDKGHIPSAIKIDWKKDLQDPVRRDFVDKTGFEALLSERGISNDDTVLLYGGNNNWFAAYAYWYFRLYGHDKVLLLDGGRKKWELDSRELTRDVPERARTSYQATEQDASLRALRDEVIAAFLNGAFGLCLGCEMYLLIRRIVPSQATGAGQS